MESGSFPYFSSLFHAHKMYTRLVAYCMSLFRTFLFGSDVIITRAPTSTHCVQINACQHASGHISAIQFRPVHINTRQYISGGMSKSYNTLICRTYAQISEHTHTCADISQKVGHWDTNGVTDMRTMFASTFNQPIDYWDLSSVTDMYLMFASAFNQPIGYWDVSAVTAMCITLASAPSQ